MTRPLEEIMRELGITETDLAGACTWCGEPLEDERWDFHEKCYIAAGLDDEGYEDDG